MAMPTLKIFNANLQGLIVFSALWICYAANNVCMECNQKEKMLQVMRLPLSNNITT
jgi:hypothetical protein